MDLTDFLKTGMYLGLKVGLAEEEIYSCLKKKIQERNIILTN